MNDQMWTALLSVVGGGVGLKVIEWWKARGEQVMDEGKSIRQELREQLKEIRDEMKGLRTELDQEKGKYATLLEEHVKLEARYEVMQEELSRLRGELGKQQQLEKELDDLRQKAGRLKEQLQAAHEEIRRLRGDK